MKFSTITRAYTSFALPEFRWLWLVITLSNAGQWTFLLVAGWQIYTITQSSVWAGAIVFALFVPNLVGSPITGVLTDRFNRQHILTAALITSAGFNLMLGVTTLMNVVTAPVLFWLTLAYGTSLSVLGVSTNTLVPGTVSANQVSDAVYLQSIAQRGAEFVGPALASPLLVQLGPSAVYGFTVVLYVAATLFATRLRGSQSTVQRGNHSLGFLTLLTSGVQYILRTKSLKSLIVFTSSHCILTMAYIGLLPSFALAAGVARTGFYGALLTFAGLGAIVGILTLTLPHRPVLKLQLLWWTATVSALSLGALSIPAVPWVSEVSVFVAGLSQGMFMTISVAMIQELTTEHFRGRVSSVYLVTTGGFMSVANWGYAAIGAHASTRLLFAVMGLVFLITVPLFWVRTPSLHPSTHAMTSPVNDS